MYFFILHIFVYFIHEADLRHASRNVLDGAADTARLINLVQRIGNFEERYPINNTNDGTKGTNAGDLEFEAMKLLQKNYDVARKFNDRVEVGNNIQYIVNPEVIAAYRQLPEEHTEEYDDISDQANTQRSYVRELERIEKPPLHEMRNFRRENEHITANTSKLEDANSKDSDSSNDAGEDTKVSLIPETKEEDQAAVKANTENNSKDTKERHPKSAETFKLLKPIVEQMLSKYSEKVSQEKEKSFEVEVKDVSKKKKKKIDEQNHKEDNIDKIPLNNNKRDESEKNIAVLREKKNELNIPKKKNDAESLSSNRQKKKKKKQVLHKKQSNERVLTEDERDLRKDSASVNEKDVPKPTVTIEENKSEETQGGLSEESKKEQTKEFKNKLNSKKRHKTVNFGSQPKTEKRINKEINSKENKNKKTFISMEETVIDWKDYDEDKKVEVQHSDKNDEVKSSKSNKNKYESEKYDKYKDSKKISTKRKGDDDWGDKFNSENKKDNSKNKKQNWGKTEDDDWDKKDKPKKDRDWSKDDGSKEDDWNKKDSKKKKDDSWNKKNDDDDWNKKDDNSNKKKDNWDKKNINWDSKEETKVEKNNNWDKPIDTSFKKPQNTKKRDSAWDNVGIDKKQNSGWGNYDSFKNIKDKTTNNDRDYSRQEKRRPPKVETRPKYQSWNRPAARDDYYERPRKNQGRQSPFRTSIPFVGQKAVYAD